MTIKNLRSNFSGQNSSNLPTGRETNKECMVLSSNDIFARAISIIISSDKGLVLRPETMIFNSEYNGTFMRSEHVNECILFDWLMLTSMTAECPFDMSSSATKRGFQSLNEESHGLRIRLG